MYGLLWHVESKRRAKLERAERERCDKESMAESFVEAGDVWLACHG